MSDNQVENSHQPVRRRERKMQWFKNAGQPESFLSIHATHPTPPHFRQNVPRLQRIARSAQSSDFPFMEIALDHNAARISTAAPLRSACKLPTKSAFSGARRVDVSGFGVPEHHGGGSALPNLVQCGNLSLDIWSSGGYRLK